MYLSGSTFLVTFTIDNKQSSSVKFMFKPFDHVSNSYEIYKLTYFLWGKDSLSCFKQIPSNFTFPNWKFPTYFKEKIMSGDGFLIFSSEIPVETPWINMFIISMISKPINMSSWYIF